MCFDEARLLDIPRSRRIIASFDPKHDLAFEVYPLLSQKDPKVSLIHLVIVVRVSPRTFRSITDLLLPKMPPC